MNQQAISLGSLCTGYGGLDMAFMKAFSALAPALAWVADNNRHASTLLATHSPDVPNLGDLEHVDWRLIDPVDAVCAGFPCQDISFAGLGAGIVHFLKDHPGVRQVRLPDAQAAGGLVGGQLSCHAASYELAAMTEIVVGQNAGRSRSDLHLACTFGSAMTTFEHFASNLRSRTGIPREATNEVSLPDDIVRIGIGCEPVRDIIADLGFALSSAVPLSKQH